MAMRLAMRASPLRRMGPSTPMNQARPAIREALMSLAEPANRRLQKSLTGLVIRLSPMSLVGPVIRQSLMRLTRLVTRLAPMRLMRLVSRQTSLKLAAPSNPSVAMSLLWVRGLARVRSRLELMRFPARPSPIARMNLLTRRGRSVPQKALQPALRFPGRLRAVPAKNRAVVVQAGERRPQQPDGRLGATAGLNRLV